VSSDGDTSQDDWVDLLIELAAFERAINEVFDGPGSENLPALEASQWTSISPADWGEAQVTMTPSLRLIESQFPLNDFFSAARAGNDPPIPARRPTWLALTRRQYIVRRHELSRPQYEMLAGLLEGQTLGEAIARAIQYSSVEVDAFAAELREWFQTWSAAGFFTAIEMRGVR